MKKKMSMRIMCFFIALALLPLDAIVSWAAETAERIITYSSANSSKAVSEQMPETPLPIEEVVEEQLLLTCDQETDTSVSLSWSNTVSTYGASYDIYLDSVLIKEDVIGSSYVVNGLDPASEHDFSILAKDSDGNIILSSNTLSVVTDLRISENYTLWEETNVGNLYIDSGTFDLNEQQLNINGNLIISGGKFIVNGGTVNIDGDLRLQREQKYSDGTANYYSSTGYLVMQNENDYITVNGDFVTQSSYTHSGYLTNGVLEVKGNFTQITYSNDKNFYATDNHRTVLSGEGLQTVQMASANSKFAALELCNYSDEGVYFAQTLNADAFERNGCKVSFIDSGVWGWQLTDDEVYSEDLFVVGGTLDLNGHKLTVEGDLTQSGVIDINGGELEVRGDYKQSNNVDINGGQLKVIGSLFQYDGTMNINGGTLEVTKDYTIQGQGLYGGSCKGILQMINESDLVKIGGSFSTSSSVNHTDYLTAGRFELGGDLTTGSFSSYDFNATGTHTLVLNGATKQTIKIRSTNNRINNLEITNTSEDGVTFTDSACVRGTLYNTDSVVNGSAWLYITEGATLENDTWPYDLTIYQNYSLNNDWVIGGSLYLGYKSALDMNGHTVNVTEDVVIGDGTLQISGGKLYVGRDLRAQGFKIQDDGTIDFPYTSNGHINMTNESDYILVNRDFIMYSSGSYKGYLTDGVMEIKGDFTQTQYSSYSGDFIATDNHKVIFSGDKKQTISIETPSCKFATVELLNKSKDGVYVSSCFNAENVIYNGCKLEFANGGKPGWTMTSDETFDSLTLVYGTLDLNGHKLTIKGDLIQSGGIIDINGGELEVTGDYKIQTASGGESTGILKMTNENDRVKVKGSFVTRSTMDHSKLLTDGILEIGGDFYEYQNLYARNFFASGNHTIVFNGNKKQTINIESPYYCQFANLKIMNSSIDGVNFESAIYIATALYNTDSIVNGSHYLHLTNNAVLIGNSWSYDLAIYNTITLDADWIIKGSLYLDGSLDINGYRLNVGNDLCLAAGTLNINEGQVYVGRDFKMQGYTILADGTMAFWDSSRGYLKMTNESDYVLVNRDFVVYMYNSQAGYLTNGILEIKGDFTNDGYNGLSATDNHRVIFSGDKKQTIYITSPYARFAIVDLQNTSEDGVFISYYFDADKIIANDSKLESANGGKAGWTLTNDEVVDGFTLAYGVLDLNGYKLTVEGDFIHSGGTVFVNGGELVVSGDYKMHNPSGSTSSGVLNMTNESDLVKVNGSFITNTSVENSKFLIAGTLEVGGDLTNNSYYFTPSGKHTIVLNGNEKQTIYFSSLSNLKITNASKEGVCFENNTYISTGLYNTDSIVNGSHFIYLNAQAVLADCSWPYDLNIGAGVTINADWNIGGSLYLRGGTLDLKGHKLKIGNHLYVSSGILYINSGELYVAGDLCIQSFTIKSDGSLTTSNYSNGYLQMINANDYVMVGRNFVMQAYSSHNGYLTNGTLEVKGDFSQLIYKTYGNMNFYATGNHKVILSGNKKQTIKFQSADSCFATLELKNTSDDGVYVSSNFKVDNIIVNDSKISFANGGKVGWTLQNNEIVDELVLTCGTLDLNGHKLTVKGSLIQSGGIININGGELEVTGDYRIESSSGDKCTGILNMTNESDIVKIKGSFVSRSMVNHSLYMTAGVMEIGGDLYTYNGSYNFMASGTHTVILNGTDPQIVKLYSLSSHFNNLKIDNISDGGVKFEDWAVVEGVLYSTESVVRGGYWLYLDKDAVLEGNKWPYDLGILYSRKLNADWEIGGSLYIYNDTLDLNGHKLNVGDDLVVNSGTLYIDGGQLYIGRDLRVQSYTLPYNGGSITYGTSSSGYIKMVHAQDYVRVNRDFLTYSSRSHEGYLTNGLLEVKGDVIQGYSNSYNSGMYFYATDNHKVVLSGTKLQNVSFIDDNSSFNILEINKPLDTGYEFNRVPVWKKLVETVKDTQAPSAPQNLVSDVHTFTVVSLKWNESTDDVAVIGYDIYRNGERIGSTDKTEYIDDGLKPGQTYIYYVVAFDAMRNESEWSNILEITTAKDENAPTKPTNLTVKSRTESSITLTWNASIDNSKVEGYEVYRDDMLIGTVKGTSFTDRSLTSDCYTYYVIAFDDMDNYSDPSDPIFVDIEAPTAPVLIVESKSNTSAVISWTASDNIGVAKYEVYRDGEKIATVTDNTYTDRTLSYDNTYEYYVVAYDDAGNTSEQSNVVSVYTGEDTEAPRITAITPSSGVYAKSIPIKVYATDNYSVASVTLQTSSDNTNWENAIVIDADGKTSSIIEHDFDLSGYYDGTLYIRAIAEDSKGNTSDVSLSPIAKYTVDNTAPGVPLNISASEVNGQLEIRWDNTKAPDLDYYRIYKADSGDDDFTLIKDEYMYLNYFDNEIELAETYDYYVTAVDMAGNESIKSEIVTGGILKDILSPKVLSVVPTNGFKVGEGHSMSISCKDNFRLASITVEFCPEGLQSWKVMYMQNLSQYAEIVTFDLEMDNLPDGIYNFRIKLTDQAGNESAYYTTSLDYKSCSIAAPKLYATPKGWQVQLNWSSTDDPSLAGYTIYKRSANDNKFKVLERTVLNEFTDNQVTAGKSYFYYVEAMDTYGNVISSEIVMVIPTDEDEIAPVAVAGLDLYGIAGTPISFDGSASTDNHYIAEYEWDFGDGTTGSTAKASHTYATEGIYTATLTVWDSAGNSASEEITVTVYSDDEYTFAQFRLLDSRTNTPVPYAMVHVDLPDGEEIFETDSSGNIRIISPEGTYKVSFYKDGYLPVAVDAVIEKNGPVVIVYIENGELVTGQMTVERLESDDIVNRGVDITDPNNQYVYKHEVEAEYNGRKGKFTYVTNGAGDIIDVKETWTEFLPPSFGDSSSNSNTSSSGAGAGSGGSISHTAIPSGDPSQPPSIAILNITTTVSWLKEFFGVDLYICNNATSDFSIDKSTVQLNLPDGISLAKTSEDNSAYKDLGEIRGQDGTEAHWTIRGDKAGEYMISADFSGYLMPFNTKVNVTFKPDGAVTVIGGDALKLEIINRVWSEDNGRWIVDFTLTNVSDVPIYNPSINYSGYAEGATVYNMTLVYPNGMIEVIPWENGKEVKSKIARFMPALKTIYDSDIITIGSGESIVGRYEARW